jgi:hypothetical protein
MFACDLGAGESISEYASNIDRTPGWRSSHGFSSDKKFTKGHPRASRPRLRVRVQREC